MRRALPLALLTLLLAGCASPGPPQDDSTGAPLIAQFDHSPTGAFPSTWILAGGQWKVVADATAPSRPNAVEGRANATGERAMIVPPTGTYSGVNVSLFLRAGEGPGARGGLAFHIDGANDYDAAVLDLERGELQFVTVRSGFAIVQANLTAAASGSGWHNVTVELRGPTARARVDGGANLTATLVDPGARQVGLWVEGTSSVVFDDLLVKFA
jgi:hypothetical protein